MGVVVEHVEPAAAAGRLRCGHGLGELRAAASAAGAGTRAEHDLCHGGGSAIDSSADVVIRDGFAETDVHLEVEYSFQQQDVKTERVCGPGARSICRELKGKRRWEGAARSAAGTAHQERAFHQALPQLFLPHGAL